MRFNKFTSSAGMAMATIWSHKLRSLLTVLGVIIGTSTIIGVGSIITGMDGAITEIFRSFGPNTLIVFKFKVGVRFHHTAEERQRKPLSLDNARALSERCPSVEHVSPFLFPLGGFHRAKYQANDMYNIEMGGTEEGYAENGTEMLYGRFLTDAESLHRRPVAVIGEDVYKALFSNVDPIGKWIEVDGQTVEVIGVMKRPPFSFPGYQDSRVLFPYFTMKKMYPAAKENMFIVIAKEGLLARAQDEVRTVLRIERRVPHDKPDSFSISSSEQLVEDFREVMSTTALVMVVLSSIGLLVGGIGVMNIMLVSVTERTREIGVRKAVGARRADIVIQFLTEAVVLTGLGGFMGMFVGWLISLASRMVFPSMPTSVPLWAAIM
ncbi:MAG: FtsX-like permease family protein, partial [bacterium]|nr:FtsX-like permease family protein [bacterium]